MQKTTSLCAPSRSDDTMLSRKHTADEGLSLLDEEAIGRWLEASGCPDAASPEEACAEAEANPLREGLPSDSPLSESCASEAASAEPCGEEEVRVPGEGRVVRFTLHGTPFEVTEAEIAEFVDRAQELERIVASPQMKGLQQLAQVLEENPDLLTRRLPETGCGQARPGSSESLLSAAEEGLPSSERAGGEARLRQEMYQDAEDRFNTRLAQLRSEIQDALHESRRALAFDLTKSRLMSDPDYPRIVECIRKKLHQDVADGHVHYSVAAELMHRLDSDPEAFSRAFAYFRRRLSKDAQPQAEDSQRMTVAPALNGSSAAASSPHGARRATVWNRALQGDTESIGSLWD